MRSQLLLCLLVGFTYASNNPAWKDNTEYVYLVNGRTFSSLHEATDQYSGIVLKAKLTINPYSDGNLQGSISDAKYSQIHTYLPEGWLSVLPESQLSFKPLEISKKPFKMVLENGLVKKLIVEKEVMNWEVNIIKSIASQFQWDVQGKNAIYSPMNDLPNKEKFDGVFKTMEETVTGKTETLYEIHPLPEYYLQTENKLPVQKKENEQVIEVIKSKNYTNAEERPSYHYGFGEVKEHEPTSNKMGKFFIREGFSRAVLTGRYEKYLIQKAFTVNKIYVNPTFNNKEMGSVISMVNITLSQFQPQAQQPQPLADPLEVGSLTYTYENPFANDSRVIYRPRIPGFEAYYSSETLDYIHSQWRRYGRAPAVEQNADEEYAQYQPRPTMENPPDSPLLPYLVGYKGLAVKNRIGVDSSVNIKRLVSDISKEVEDPEKILRQSTLDKFTIVCTLLRLMNEQEIRTLADKLYTKSQEGQEYVAWKVFINALAEVGTGPAFLNIQQLIESKKIQGAEAADLISTMARSVRVPTEDYMKKFYELVTKPEIQKQDILNETAILSYTELVYKVYINRNASHNQFPVHSFGSFATKTGHDYIVNTVIPEFTKKLHDAISRGDTRQTHVYIYALGNIGHRKILEAFEPYLEGQKQCSQFQRMLMVLALDHLISYTPITARSVCYKIYINTGEIPELRVIAVYQLMRTHPPVEMLQRMAESTHIEKQEQVVAAIKSAIETAALSKSPEHYYLQQAAEAAKPLLTRKYYAGDYSFIDLRDYVIQNMNVEFKHKFLQIGGSDSNWPKVVNLGVRGNINGMNHKYLSLSGVLSSVKDLMNVLRKQTQEYEKIKSERCQQQSGESKWSSVNIAKILNYQTEEREQLEALIFTEIEHIQKLWSFDNQTVERLPEFVREQEEMLKKGKKINIVKLKQVDEMALSFPTEMGVPFLYTHDMPVLVRIEGTIKAVANPPISSNNKLHKPDQIAAEIDGHVTLSTRAQSHLSFVTPFDHEIYTAGFDRNLQGYLPIRVKVAVDVKSKTAEIEFQVKDTQKNSRLLHYSTWPYTSIGDLLTIEPVSLRKNTRVIQPEVGRSRYFDVVFGKKNTGLALRSWGYHPVQSINLKEIAEMLTESDNYRLIWQQLWDKASMKQTAVNIEFIPSQSTVRKFYLRYAQQSQYRKQPEVEQEEEFLSYGQLSSKAQIGEPKKRMEEIVKHVSSGIMSSKSWAFDVAFEFEGDKKYQHVLGAALAKSDAGPISRTLIYYWKNADKEHQCALEVKGNISNTNGLDLTYSLNSEPKGKYEVRVQYGQNEQEASVVSGSVDLCRSEARKQYLIVQEPLFQICKKEMEQGNFVLPACQNLTIQANYLDDIKIEMQYEKMKREHVNIVEGFFKGARVYYYPMTEIKQIAAQSENKVWARIQFQPEHFRRVNFTIKTKDEETRLFNLTIDSHVVRSLVVPHPVFHLKSRVLAVLKGWQNLRPTCVIDQTVAQTFNNRTYPLSLENKYTVVMQYVPKDARWDGPTKETVPELLTRYYENYVVLVRQMTPQKKEVIITFNHPDTQGKTVEIYMRPKEGQPSASNPASSVLVDNQEMQFTDQQIADLYDGYVQIYALPNGEVKVEFQGAFYLIFDGKRIKVTSTSSKLHDSVSGLCGPFSKDKYEDFSVPARCVVRDYNKFVQSYVVEGGQVPRQQRSHEFKQQCMPKIVPLYTDVISDLDAGRQEAQKDQGLDSNTRYRVRYVEENSRYCFSIRPLPECVSSRPANVVSKMIPVHCVESSKSAMHFKNQIDKGIQPDFSSKSETTRIPMDVPQTCE